MTCIQRRIRSVLTEPRHKASLCQLWRLIRLHGCAGWRESSLYTDHFSLTVPWLKQSSSSYLQGAKSVTSFEILPPPPKTRGPSNPWPLFPRVFKMDYGHEEVDVKFGRDPRIFNICSKVNSSEIWRFFYILSTVNNSDSQLFSVPTRQPTFSKRDLYTIILWSNDLLQKYLMSTHNIW